MSSRAILRPVLIASLLLVICLNLRPVVPVTAGRGLPASGHKTRCITKKVHGKKRKVCTAVHLFDAPSGVAVGGDGSVYVADAGRNHVLKMSQDTPVLATIGGAATASGGLNHPWGLALDAHGDLYVSEAPGFTPNRVFDVRPRRIVKLSPAGEIIAQAPKATTDADIPCGMALDAEGNVYVADFGGAKILKFDTNLHPTATLVTLDPWPCGIVRMSGGDVYVSQGLTEDVGHYSAAGQQLPAIGSRDNVDPPFGLAFDGDRAIYVVNVAHSRIVKYSLSGQKLTSWGGSGAKPGQFWFNEAQMLGIAVGQDGNVYVSDAGNRRVQKFSPTGALLDVWQ